MARSLAVHHRDHRISYSGHWVVLPAVHFSTEQNATVAFDFDGFALSIFGTVGMVGAATPPLAILLDGQDDSSFSFDSERPHILYSSPPLQQGHHTLSLVLLTNSSFLSIEGMLIATTDIVTRSEPLSQISWVKLHIIEIICGIAAGAMIILGLFLALFIIFRRRRRQTILNSAGPLRVALPTTKEAFTSRNCSTYGLIFLPYDPGSTDNFTPLPPRRSRARLKRHNLILPPSGIQTTEYH